ncbi:MAG: sulfatase-like hydrolase/transferase [Acidobacteriota bacterium]
MRNQILKDAARALSLANLFFTSQWIALLDINHFWFGKFSLFSFKNILALLVNVCLFGALLFAAMQLFRRSKNDRLLQTGRLLFSLLFFLFAAVAILPQLFGKDFSFQTALLRSVGYFNLTELRALGTLITASTALLLKHRLRYGIGIFAGAIFWLAIKTEFLIALTILLIAVSLVFIWLRHHIVKVTPVLTLILFPFFIWTSAQGIYLMSKSFTHPQATRNAAAPSSQRVVWIVFDGLDYSQSFGKRAATLNLPAFDGLRQQAVSAKNAYPPAGFTLMSIPALFTGRLVSKVRPASPADMLINFDGANESQSLAAESTVFSDAYELNYRTALAGWAIPYHRIFGKQLTSGFGQEVRDENLLHNMWGHFRRAIENLPGFPGLKAMDSMQNKWERQEHCNGYRNILQAAKPMAANSDYGLVFIHLPVPHPPGIYDREKAAFELDEESCYLDNLALADKALGAVREAMEDAGEWDKSTVIVSSDHWWRPYIWKPTPYWTKADDEVIESVENVDHRIPFMVKLPGQKVSMEYEPAFNTVLTRNFIATLLRNQLHSAENVKAWLDENRSIAESPYAFEKIPEGSTP